VFCVCNADKLRSLLDAPFILQLFPDSDDGLFWLNSQLFHISRKQAIKLMKELSKLQRIFSAVLPRGVQIGLSCRALLWNHPKVPSVKIGACARMTRKNKEKNRLFFLPKRVVGKLGGAIRNEYELFPQFFKLQIFKAKFHPPLFGV